MAIEHRNNGRNGLLPPPASEGHLAGIDYRAGRKEYEAARIPINGVNSSSTTPTYSAPSHSVGTDDGDWLFLPFFAAVIALGVYVYNHTGKSDPSAAKKEITATVNAQELNVRSGPGTDNDIETVTMSDGTIVNVILDGGTKVKVIGQEDNGWDKIEAPAPNGQTVTGYSNGKFLTSSP